MDKQSNDYVDKYFSFELFKQRIPAEGEKVWWIAVSDSGAGALLGAGKKNQLLYFESFDGGLFINCSANALRKKSFWHMMASRPQNVRCMQNCSAHWQRS